jgi:peptidyl-prolyl cis-trans isomerase C
MPFVGVSKNPRAGIFCPGTQGKEQEMKKALLIAVMALAVAGLAACSGSDKGKPAAQTPSGGGKNLATIGKTVITVKDFEDKINRQNPYLRSRFSDPARRKEFLDTMIKGEVLYSKALSMGYDRDPDVMDRMKADMIQKMIHKDFDEKMKDSLVSADDVKKFYSEHNTDYNKPEAVWVKIIQNKEKAKVDAALKEAKGKVEDQNFYTEIVKKYSDDEKTNKTGGDITYRTRDEISADYGKELADAAFNMDKIGDLTPKAVHSKGNWYAVRLQGKRPAQNRTLEQVEGQIKNRLYYEKRSQAFEKWVGDMIQTANVTRNDALLSEVKIEAPQGPQVGGPAMPPPKMPPAALPPVQPATGPGPHPAQMPPPAPQPSQGK